MKVFRNKKIRKKYAAKAAMYRRAARNMGCSLDFSLASLIELYEFESIGSNGLLFSDLKQRNGFAMGKWLRDIDVSQMCEDVRNGDFCKAEFLSTAISRIHNRDILEKIISGKLFAYIKHYPLPQTIR